MTENETLLDDWRTFMHYAKQTEERIATHGGKDPSTQAMMAYVIGLAMGLCGRAGATLEQDRKHDHQE